MKATSIKTQRRFIHIWMNNHPPSNKVKHDIPNQVKDHLEQLPPLQKTFGCFPQAVKGLFGRKSSKHRDMW